MVKLTLYEKLKKEYPTMAKYVKAFPEAVQVKAFETLYNAYLAHMGVMHVEIPKGSQAITRELTDLNGVAELLPDGSIELTARDLKSKNLEDAVRRAVYVAIRAKELLTGNKSANKKNIVLKSMKKSRLTSGAARNALARVPGLIKVGNEWSLDGPAKDEADRYIREIKDDSIQGKFKPGSISRPRKKKSIKKAKQK